MSELNCSVCGIQLSSNFEVKAEARNWDHSKLVCVDHSDEVDGMNLLPKE
jgi:hypothetical protein